MKYLIVLVKIVPEMQANYGFDFDEVLSIIDSKREDEEIFYLVSGRKFTCWIKAEELRLERR